MEEKVTILQRKNGSVLLFGGHQYYRHKIYKNKTVNWTCCNKSKKKCSGSLTLNGDEILRMVEHKTLSEMECVVDNAKNELAMKMDSMKKGIRTVSALSRLGPLTKASTISDMSPSRSNRLSRMEVRAGSSYTTHGGQLANIQEVMKHPRWGLRKNPDNDVALILLDRNIKFSDSCHGVDLPNRVMVPAFDDAWVVSFGAERRDGMYDLHTDGLQVYHTFMMSNESCNNVTMRFGVTVTENFICFTQSGKTSPCTRDTGAPAVSDGVVWGLASWGIRKLCGTERFPSMFSYLASHSNMDFIADATRRLMSEKRIYQFLDRTFAPRVKFSGTTARERIG